MESIGLPKSRHMGKMSGEGTTGCQLLEIPRVQSDQAHLYVLHNTVEVEPYVEMHKNIIKSQNPSKTENWIAKEHNQTFILWLRGHIFELLRENSNSVSERIKWLSNGPRVDVFSYSSYLINGYTFYTKEHDEQSIMQNSGVTLVA